MKKYKVTIKEVNEYIVDLYAENEETAETIALNYQADGFAQRIDGETTAEVFDVTETDDPFDESEARAIKNFRTE